MSTILTLLQKLLAVPSPTGREERMAAVVGAELDELGVPYETDRAGNLLVRLPGTDPAAPLCCLAAHMDEIGMVVKRIEDDGALQVRRSGGLMPWKIGEGPVLIIGDAEPLIGVLSMGSTHDLRDEKKGIGWEEVRIMTGLTPAQLADRGIRPGATAVPATDRRGPVLFGDRDDPLAGAWTFDDRAGVAVLIRLLARLRQERLQPAGPTIVAFTVSEEVGGQGAKNLARREQPQIFIAVDGAPLTPGSSLELDGRPAIWSKDRLGHYDQQLLRELQEAATTAGTALQPVIYEGAASDASLLYYAGLAPRVACLGHPRANSHGYEVLRLAVLENVVQTLLRFLDKSAR
jgi:putative aminopeptidase FrvX